MKERGILFSAPMVRAILDGSKSQTRRIVKHRSFGASDTPGYDWTFRNPRTGGCWNDVTHARMLELCPYGIVGDRLWVRETWCVANPEYSYPRPDDRPVLGDRWCYYAATDPDVVGEGERADGSERSPWRPSIFMPRWASRITLEVTSVRVERLQSITEADAKAEGVRPFPLDLEGDCWTDGTYRTAYNHLWNEINGWNPNSWVANPWVWVVEFKRVEQP